MQVFVERPAFAQGLNVLDSLQWSFSPCAQQHLVCLWVGVESPDDVKVIVLSNGRRPAPLQEGCTIAVYMSVGDLSQVGGNAYNRDSASAFGGSEVPVCVKA